MRRHRGWTRAGALLALLFPSCDANSPTTPPPPPDRDALFTPWHRAEQPSPFPQGVQWHWRKRLSEPPAEDVPPDNPDAAAQLRAALPTLAGTEPLETEPLLEEWEALASQAPQTLIEFLDDPHRDVRYGCARLLFRLMTSGSPPIPNQLAAAAAKRLRDEADEVALLHLETLSHAPGPWPIPRLIKTFGRYDNHLRVVVRARAAMHLVKRGNYSGFPLFLKILKEQTSLQDDLNREWESSLRTAWWKEEALKGVVLAAGEDFGFSPDAIEPAQAASIRRIEEWWNENRQRLWEQSPAMEDPELVRRVQEIILAMGTFQLRNVDNAVFLLTQMGPPVAPWLFEALQGSNFQIRRHCLEILAALMPWATEATRREWLQELTGLLSEDDPALQVRVLNAIGASRLPEALSHLEQALLGGNPSHTEVAALQLANFSTAEARELLTKTGNRFAQDDPRWLPVTAARIRADDHGALEDFLDVLRGGGDGADRASIYLSWLVDTDDYGQARSTEERNREVERLRTEILTKQP